METGYNQNHMEDRAYPMEQNPAITAQHPTGVAGQDNQKKILVIIIVVTVLVLAAVIAGVIFLLQPTTDTARIRDVFIIFMALGSLLIGLALVILMIQMARLINLLQNEIKPILDSTNETVSNLRGTTVFLSENLTEPVIKLNEYLAGFSQVFKLVGLTRKRPK